MKTIASRPLSISLIILSMLSLTPAMAATQTTKPQLTQQQATAKGIFYCPPIKALQKSSDDMTWSAKPGWKSYDASFVERVGAFIGAQWKGANVGQAFCVYRGVSKTTFPIVMSYHTLTKAPQDGKWGKLDKGVVNCKSNQQKGCPLIKNFRPKDTDPFKELEEPDNNMQLQNPGF